MRNDVCIFALSINSSELSRKLLYSLYANYTPEQIAERNFQVVCQGYDPTTIASLREKYPEITFLEHERVQGTISFIRDTLVKEYGVLDNYKYVVFIDDDFKYGPKAFEQYDYFFEELDKNPNIGFVAMHRRIKTVNRQQISPLECPYPHDLGAISMRNGLVARTSAVPESGLFSPDIKYHEEMYMAMQIYLNGYDIAKGWMDIFHQSNKAGLGCKLQKQYNISQSNEVMSSKKKAYELGLFEIEEGRPFYEGQDCGCLNEKAHTIHAENKARRVSE